MLVNVYLSIRSFCRFYTKFVLNNQNISRQSFISTSSFYFQIISIIKEIITIKTLNMLNTLNIIEYFRYYILDILDKNYIRQKLYLNDFC